MFSRVLIFFWWENLRAAIGQIEQLGRENCTLTAGWNLQFKKLRTGKLLLLYVLLPGFALFAIAIASIRTVAVHILPCTEEFLIL